MSRFSYVIVLAELVSHTFVVSHPQFPSDVRWVLTLEFYGVFLWGIVGMVDLVLEALQDPRVRGQFVRMLGKARVWSISTWLLLGSSAEPLITQSG